jgi:hypothetical protein
MLPSPSANHIYSNIGPNIVIRNYASVTKIWTTDGIISRDDGPAIEYYSSHKVANIWVTDGVVHRIEGPAIIVNRGHGWDKKYVENGHYTGE